MMHLSFRKNIRTYDSEVTGIVIQLLLILITQSKITFVSILHVPVRYFVSVFKYFFLSTFPRDVALRLVPDPEHHPAGDPGRGQPAGAEPVVRIQVDTQI